MPHLYLVPEPAARAVREAAFPDERAATLAEAGDQNVITEDALLPG